MSLLQIKLEEIPPTQFGEKLCPYNWFIPQMVTKLYTNISWKKYNLAPKLPIICDLVFQCSKCNKVAHKLLKCIKKFYLFFYIPIIPLFF
jgi:hypothetical protein